LVKNSHESSFKLLRWFGLLSIIVIIGIAVAQALLISNFLSSRIFQREGELSRDFVQNILVADGSLDYLFNPNDEVLAARFKNTIEHIKNMHDLLRANVYKTDGTVLWSSDQEMIGHRFPGENDELEEALKGELVINPAHISEWLLEKKEHVGINPAINYFVECYIPVIHPQSGKIIGVVELYRAPIALTQAIEDGRAQVWIAAIASAIALFGSLFWIVSRADTTIKRQHSRLLETETLAVLGELASSIAHNIRNPLSSIRSSAELALEAPKDDCTEQANDIIHEVDRIGRQISELLNFSAEDSQHSAIVDLKVVLERCISQYIQSFERKHQTLSFNSTATNSKVSADEALLQQVFLSIMSNASEAMEGDGTCTVNLMDEDKNFVCVEIVDTGSGIAPEVLSKIFRPFFTTKPKGLGLGLSLARKIIARFGGTITFLNNNKKGTIVKILLPRN
jgi:two-component system sensor histidine kinase HydH